jgi:hypothetical protein
MAETKKPTAARPGYFVFHQIREGDWRLVGEADRVPGHTARAARARAIRDATGGKAKDGEIYAAVLRSEWRIALEC